MKGLRDCSVLGALCLAACSTVPYQKPVASLAATTPVLKTAQATYSASAKTATDLTHAQAVDAALLKADALVIKTDCKPFSDNALSQALVALETGKDLDGLYAPGGAMTRAPACYGDVVGPQAEAAPAAPPVPAAPQPAAATPKDNAAKSFDQKAAEDEAAADAAYCRTARKVSVPAPPAGGPAPDPGDLDAVWSGIDKYTAGLADITSADNSKSLSDATTGAASAINKDLATMKAGSAFAPAVTLLFAVFDAAVEQKRYEVLKGSVLCANSMFIRWRGVLRNAMRYEQIAAFSNQAHAFAHNAEVLRSEFDPAVNPQTDCPSSLLAGAPAPSPQVRRPASFGCLTYAAKQIELDPAPTPQAIFAAEAYLELRANRLRPKLVDLQSEASAASALAKGDPGPAIDAFIAAHRALRQAIVENKGQFTALQASVTTLYQDAKALDDALAPAKASAAAAKPASATTKGA